MTKLGWLWIPLGVTLAIVLFALAWPFVARSGTPTYVDVAAWLTGILQPLALAWFVGAFLLQREELVLQRTELAQTRDEISRQADALERASRVGLAQQVVTQLPVASEAIFHRFWPLMAAGNGTDRAYDSKDLSYVLRRVEFNSAAEVMYGTPESKEKEMHDRGIVDALRFASQNIAALSALADLADSGGALRALVEAKLHKSEVDGLTMRAEKVAGR